MNIGSSGGKRRGTGIRTREAEHLMTRADEFLNDCGADEACSPSDKDTHSLRITRLTETSFAVNLAPPREFISCSTSCSQAYSGCLARCSPALKSRPHAWPSNAVSDIFSALTASATLFCTAPAGA